MDSRAWQGTLAATVLHHMQRQQRKSRLANDGQPFKAKESWRWRDKHAQQLPSAENIPTLTQGKAPIWQQRLWHPRQRISEQAILIGTVAAS